MDKTRVGTTILVPYSLHLNSMEEQKHLSLEYRIVEQKITIYMLI